jgi:hypothetical protein
MIGEFGELIDEAPYLLEHLVDGFADEPAVVVRLEVRLHGKGLSCWDQWLCVCSVLAHVLAVLLGACSSLSPPVDVFSSLVLTSGVFVCVLVSCFRCFSS